EHLSLEIDHLDWLLETMVVEEDLERNQKLQLYQKPLMDQAVVEEEEVTQVGFLVNPTYSLSFYAPQPCQHQIAHFHHEG
ncbi:hypothetical protein Tco_0796769, partial [Tanacetum coccineum]